MEQRHVKITGFSVNNKFGGLEATELRFDPNNKLIVVKGEVGSGKTTLNKGLSLVTKGSKTLEDKKLYGDTIDLTAQLVDGKHQVFVNAKSDKKGKIVHSIYTIDENGNKLKDVVIDGTKLTPSNYLKSLQTELTWRLDELTSENPTVQRHLLLELYSNELSEVGVVFDKKSPKYVGGIIDQIEKAKRNRSVMDMRRKEVGGIADDLNEKGIDHSSRRKLKNSSELEDELLKIKSKIALSTTNLEQQRENDLLVLQNKGSEINLQLIQLNKKIVDHNKKVDLEIHNYNEILKETEHQKEKLKDALYYLLPIEDYNITFDSVISKMINHPKPILKKQKEIVFNEKNQCTSNLEEFEDLDVRNKLEELILVKTNYVNLKKEPLSNVDNSHLEDEVKNITLSIESNKIWNSEAKAINSLHDWKEANQEVKDLKQDYYLKLTEINTGVKGLHIIPEKDDSGNIFLAYNGEYDTDYFHNKDKELRKLSAYSDTQKPMICLLIQKFMLSKKAKTMPYLWIDKVPIDNKTRSLIEKMSEDLNLWLFVSWTGDFEKENLNNGEILIDNGEIFFN